MRSQSVHLPVMRGRFAGIDLHNCNAEKGNESIYCSIEEGGLFIGMLTGRGEGLASVPQGGEHRLVLLPGQHDRSVRLR